MTADARYPIGQPGVPWGAAEVATWRGQRVKRRSYAQDVLAAIETLRPRFDVDEYAALDYAGERFPLMALRSRGWRDDRPIVLVTGGVHGYETSGVHGALQFAGQHAAEFAARANLLVVPCVSPWSYERVERWNPEAIDPNRHFRESSPCAESAALVNLVTPIRDRVLMHIDLHETTDSDVQEFRPALAARDGKDPEGKGIPDGFYLVDDTDHSQPAFQAAIIAAVARVTHIATADDEGRISGSPQLSPGVISLQVRGRGLCAGVTNARYATTTEVYPDSPRTNAQECNDAQVAAVRAAIDYALAHRADG